MEFGIYDHLYTNIHCAYIFQACYLITPRWWCHVYLGPHQIWNQSKKCAIASEPEMQKQQIFVGTAWCHVRWGLGTGCMGACDSASLLGTYSLTLYVGYHWATDWLWMNLTSGEGRDCKQSFVWLHRVEMQGPVGCANIFQAVACTAGWPGP